MEHHDIDHHDIIHFVVGMLDTDGSGGVNHDEAMAFVEHMGWDVSEEDMHAFGAMLDHNEDGEVQAHEVIGWMEHEWEKMHGCHDDHHDD